MDSGAGLLVLALVLGLIAFAYAQPTQARCRQALGGGFAVLAAAGFVSEFHQALLPFVVPLLLAYLLDPVLQSLQRRGVHRVIAVSGVYIAIVGLVTVAGLLLVPPVARECVQAVTQVVDWVNDTIKEFDETPSTADYIKQHLAGPAWFQEWVGKELDAHKDDAGWWDDQRRQIGGYLQDLSKQLVGEVTSLAGWTFGKLASFAWLALLPLTFWYCLMDLGAFRRRLGYMVPPASRAVVSEIVGSINRALGSYLRGYAMLCVGLGLTQTVVLLILAHYFNFRYALLLGLYSGATYFIPYVGAYSMTILAVTAIYFTATTVGADGSVVYVHSGVHAMIGLLVVQGINSFVDTVLNPKIIGDNTGLHPLWVMFGLLAGGKLAGLVGVILATPGLFCAKIVLDHFFPRLSGPIPSGSAETGSGPEKGPGPISGPDPVSDPAPGPSAVGESCDTLEAEG
jgi:predicted PurR-regulated permease PerM